MLAEIRNSYSDIGKKIKEWAVWIFIVEAVAAIIAGIIGFFIFCSWEGDDGGFILAFLSLLAIPLAIFIEFVGTWLLYGFGELIDKTVENERNTRDILNILKKSPSKSTDSGAPKSQTENKNTEQTSYKQTASEPQPQQSFIKRSYTDDELRALPLTSLTQLYASYKITKETYDRIRNEDEKAKDEAKKKEETQVLPCPECGEDLSFMGWDDLKQKQSCPFCGKEILF